MTQVEHIAQSLNDVWMLMMDAILLVIISPQNYIYKLFYTSGVTRQMQLSMF